MQIYLPLNPFWLRVIILVSVVYFAIEASDAYRFLRRQKAKDVQSRDTGVSLAIDAVITGLRVSLVSVSVWAGWSREYGLALTFLIYAWAAMITPGVLYAVYMKAGKAIKPMRSNVGLLRYTHIRRARASSRRLVATATSATAQTIPLEVEN